MNSRIAALATATSLALSPALAQDLQAWDADADGSISEAELDDGIRDAGLFDDWDADGDGLIRPAELAEGLYGFWDANADGTLSVDEWDSAVDFWFGEDAVNLAVDAWDADGDGLISPFEFSDALAEEDLLARLDRDGEDDLLDEDELIAGFFDLADVDDDNVLTPEGDSFVVEAFEALAPDAPDPEPEPVETELDLIEEGEAFTQLPIPCGSGQGCNETARQFCAVLGFDDPIDSLAADGQLYVVRCADAP